MTTHARRIAIHRGKLYARTLDDGNRLEGEVSPCVFMYPGYPLQLSVMLTGKSGEELGIATICNPALTVNTTKENDVAKLFASIHIKPCSRCKTPAFDPTTAKTNRGGLCEGCFIADLQAKWTTEAEIESLQLALRDLENKAKGMTTRITAWIHPDAGADFQVDWYFAKRPTRSRIRALILKEGSEVLDDFRIVPL